MHTTESISRTSRWHWLWLAPVCLFVLIVAESHTLPYAIRVLHLGWQRWNWGALISPSAFFCSFVVLISLMAPVGGIVSAILLVSMSEQEFGAKVYLGALFLCLLILLLPFATDALIWGSFPFTFDHDGVGRLRMLPFIPWPDAPFGQY